MGAKRDSEGPVSLLIISLFLLLLLPCSFWNRAAATQEQGEVLQQVLNTKWITMPLPSWVPGTDPCVANWVAVVCDATGNVMTLNLSQSGLSGPVPAQLGSLSSLRVLDLSNDESCPSNTTTCGPWNEVQGDLAGLSNLTNLQTLLLTYNELSLDSFPTALLKLTELVNLRLDNTLIKGTIPAEIATLSNLQYLYLGNNSFTSPVPWGALSTVVTLRELSIWGNFFSSVCPPELSKLANLSYLNLNKCGLYGGLPPEYGQLTNLGKLSLYKNNLTGPIPDSWRSLNNLTDLEVYLNYLNGNLPSWLLQLPSLAIFRGYSNNFYGIILPSVLDKNSSPGLQSVDLQCNYFDGVQPTVSKNITALLNYNCFNSETSYDDDNSDSACDRPQTCASFYTTKNGTYPTCPVNQHLVNTSTCICFQVDAKKNISTIIISSIVGGAAFILFVILAYVIKNLRRQLTILKDIQKEFAKRDVQSYLYSYSELKAATQDFNMNHELGAGSYGIVYKGVLSDKSIIAIKHLKIKTDQALQDFLNEIVAISSIKHRNLVQLKGCCIKGDDRFLIYEFVDNKNLAEALWDAPNKRLHLDWPIRLKIIIGVARGLLYLHEDVQPAIIHRDIKPANILLDGNLNAKIADFGLALLFPELVDDQTHQSVTKVAGIRGYLAPEYAAFGQVSTKVDVFSYGILILEIVSGRKNIDMKRPTQEHYLFDWAQRLYEADQICDLIDMTILDSTVAKDNIKKVLNVALWCIHYTPAKRPSMSQVLNMLVNNMEVPSIRYSRNSFRNNLFDIEMDSMTFSTLEGESSSLFNINTKRGSEISSV